MAFCAYILASRRNATLYTGHTDDLGARIWTHKEGVGAVFTRRYGVTLLVLYEAHDPSEGAKTREYQMKVWKGAWKLELIEHDNSDWTDLYTTLNS